MVLPNYKYNSLNHYELHHQMNLILLYFTNSANESKWQNCNEIKSVLLLFFLTQVAKESEKLILLNRKKRKKIVFTLLSNEP